jgi:preprotein translocase subunit YajC
MISSAFAQAPAGGADGSMMNILFIVLMFVIIYFLMIRPQMKRAKEQKSMISALAKGDEVLTNGGILGRVDDIADQFVTLEIAPNVTVKLQKQAISAVLPKGTLKASS